MTTPGPDPYDAYRQSDAVDRRLAARLAADLNDPFTSWQDRADAVYGWLRARPTVAPAQLILTAGTPTAQPEEPVALELDLTDVQQDTFSVAATDSKGQPVPDGPFTWSEDSGGSVIAITPSADGSSCTAAAQSPGQATLTVTDPSGLTGSELVVVSPGPVASIGIVAGTPSPEAPPAGP